MDKNNIQNSGKTVKIAILTNIPTPYRRKQWEYYSNHSNLDLTIFYCAKEEKDREWEVKNAYGVREKFLKGISLFKFHFNPGILKIITGDYELFVIGGYGYPTVMMAILMLKLLKKPWIFMHDGISPVLLNKEVWYVKLIKNYFIKDADAYFANGTVGKLDLKNYGIPDDKIFNQYMTVDIDYFREKFKDSQEITMR